MNLGIVTTSLAQYGGAEIFLLECMSRWQQQARLTLYCTSVDRDLLTEYGVDVDLLEQVLLPKFDGEDRRFDLVEDVLILPRIWESLLGRHDAYFLTGCPAHLVRCSPSVYMCQEPPRMLYDLRCQFNFAEKDKLHIYPEQKYRKVDDQDLEIQLEMLENADRGATFDMLAVNSQFMARYAENVYGRKPDVISYPGVNRRFNVQEPSQGKRAIYVGRLWQHKRIDLLIRAMALLNEGGLDIVGQGPELQTLKDLVVELGLTERIVFHGALSSRQVNQKYAESTCGVYVPLREPFGMMPLEAAAAGLPVIATHEGGYTEILDDQSSIIVQPNPKAIANALCRLFDSPELAKEMGANALQCTKSITWDATADKLYSLFNRALESTKVPSNVQSRPLVGAHYYPWYDAGRPRRHWNENSEYAAVIDFPMEGVYTSHDIKTIKRHLDLAEEAGLDFLVVNWEIGHMGVNPNDLQTTRQLFAAAETRKGRVKLAITLSLHTTLEKPILESIAEFQKLAESSVWLRQRGKPALWYFISTDFFGCYFSNKKLLEESCASFVVLATGAVPVPRHLPLDLQEFVDGWSLYNPFNSTAHDEWERHVKTAYDHHAAVKPDPIRIIAVSPGYEDWQLTAPARKNGLRKVDRSNGDTYQRMLKLAAQVEPSPELIMITSFNEYHENTHIEPSFQYDDDYLCLTREFTAELQKSPAESKLYLNIDK
ncbi:MAG: glycosyltransferase [Planctomycetaceae bacterium]|nr:glycosyltransferase [Planctomycetaceae bacterium]